jgi:glutamate:GABA antiporter
MSAIDPQLEFVAAEHLVEAQSGELKKELRLGDLALSQVIYIVGLIWVGSAGELGSAHVMFWIPAVLLFYIPSGIVVIHLSQEMPLEGGLYQWAKLRFGELTGFLVALNLWMTALFIISGMVPMVTDNVVYLLGPKAGWMANSAAINLTVDVLSMGGMALVAVLGMSLAKWLHNLGGFALIATIVGMVAFALPRWIHGTATVAPVSFVAPAVTLLSLNIAAKMGFGAFCGFDGCAVFSGELRNPNTARIIRRSIFVSGPIIALLYILGTSAALAFTRPGKLDLIAPSTQQLIRATQGTALASSIGPLAALMMLVATIAACSVYFNTVIRLPMVAGWDHLLPKWLSQLHPRYKTPVGSIVCAAAGAAALNLFGSFGVGAQEAFQFLINTGIICWGLTYLVMFTIPLVARGEKPRLGVRVAAVSGFGMTLLYVVLSIFPIVETKSPLAFTIKVVLFIVALNGAGALYFFYASRRRRAAIATVL